MLIIFGHVQCFLVLISFFSLWALFSSAWGFISFVCVFCFLLLFFNFRWRDGLLDAGNFSNSRLHIFPQHSTNYMHLVFVFLCAETLPRGGTDIMHCTLLSFVYHGSTQRKSYIDSYFFLKLRPGRSYDNVYLNSFVLVYLLLVARRTPN